MSIGRKRVSKNSRGLTLIEVLITTLLMMVVFMGVSALYVSSQKLFFGSNDKIIIAYEFQYAVEHIYKNVMRAVGDETAAPASRPLETPDPSTLYVTINNNNPITRSNYGNTVTYTYSKSGGGLLFNNGAGSESLVPKITVTDLNFTLSGNVLTVVLTGSYKNQTLTFYSACYPRLASFR